MNDLKQTDLSKRLREYAQQPTVIVSANFAIQVAEEIERYYTGMLNWKATAEAKDREFVERHTQPEATAPAQKLTLENAPIGTKAPATMGGAWTRTELGWKWDGGSTFPRPGGDWNGELIAPAQDLSAAILAIPMPEPVDARCQRELVGGRVDAKGYRSWEHHDPKFAAEAQGERGFVPRTDMVNWQMLYTIDQMRDLLKAAAALASSANALSAGDRVDAERLDFIVKNCAWIQWIEFDHPQKRAQVWTQNEDEEYIILSGADKSFTTYREAIDAAILQSQKA